MTSTRLMALALTLGACASTPDTEPADPTDTGAAPGDEEEEGYRFIEDAADGASVVAVEAERYLGVWYEIASTPSPQQSMCTGTSAEYSLRDDGDVRVINRCYLDSLDGELNEIEGSARFVDDSGARLMVDFGFGFEAPYNIVDLDGASGDQPYGFAVVSSPGFALWILARDPQVDPELYTLLVDRAMERGLPADELIETLQPE